MPLQEKVIEEDILVWRSLVRINIDDINYIYNHKTNVTATRLPPGGSVYFFETYLEKASAVVCTS